MFNSIILTFILLSQVLPSTDTIEKHSSSHLLFQKQDSDVVLALTEKQVPKIHDKFFKSQLSAHYVLEKYFKKKIKRVYRTAKVVQPNKGVEQRLVRGGKAMPKCRPNCPPNLEKVPVEQRLVRGGKAMPKCRPNCLPNLKTVRVLAKIAKTNAKCWQQLNCAKQRVRRKGKVLPVCRLMCFPNLKKLRSVAKYAKTVQCLSGKSKQKSGPLTNCPPLIRLLHGPVATRVEKGGKGHTHTKRVNVKNQVNILPRTRTGVWANNKRKPKKVVKGKNLSKKVRSLSRIALNSRTVNPPPSQANGTKRVKRDVTDQIAKHLSSRIKISRGYTILTKKGERNLIAPLRVGKILNDFDTIAFRISSLSGIRTFSTVKRERIIHPAQGRDFYAIMEPLMMADHQQLCNTVGLSMATLADLVEVHTWWPTGSACASYALFNEVIRSKLSMTCLGPEVQQSMDKCFEVLSFLARRMAKNFYLSQRDMVQHLSSFKENILHLAFNNTHIFFSAKIYACTICTGKLKMVSDQSKMLQGVRDAYNDGLQNSLANLIWGTQIQFMQLVKVLDTIIIRQYQLGPQAPHSPTFRQMVLKIKTKFPKFVSVSKSGSNLNVSQTFQQAFEEVVNASIDQRIFEFIQDLNHTKLNFYMARQIYQEVNKFNSILSSRLKHISWLVADRTYIDSPPFPVLFKNTEQVQNFLAYTQSQFGKLIEDQLGAVLHIITDTKILFFQQIVQIANINVTVNWYDQLKPLQRRMQDFNAIVGKKQGFYKHQKRVNTKFAQPKKWLGQNVILGTPKPGLKQELNKSLRQSRVANDRDITTHIDQFFQKSAGEINVINLSKTNPSRHKRSWFSDALGLASKAQVDQIQSDEFKIIKKETNLELALQGVEANTKVLNTKLSTFADRIRAVQESDVKVLTNLTKIVNRQLQVDTAMSDMAASLSTSITMNRVYFQILLETELLVGSVHQFKNVIYNILHKQFDLTLFNPATLTQQLGPLIVDSLFSVEPHLFFSGQDYVLQYSLPILGDPIYQYLIKTLDCPLDVYNSNSVIKLPKKVYLNEDFRQVNVDPPETYCTKAGPKTFICEPHYVTWGGAK